MVKKAIKKFFGIDELESQVNNLEQRLGSVEIQVSQQASQMDDALSRFGDYKNRTREELELMEKQIGDLIRRFESIEIETVEEKETVIAIKSRSLKRLKNHRTRAQNALRAVG